MVDSINNLLHISANMLGTLIKDLWASRRRPGNKAPAPQETVWPVKARVAAHDSRLVIGFSGMARSGAFLGPLLALGTLFERSGYQFRVA